ncbi:MAG: hypothetical protein U1E45_04250 [Geminicoccaceae bacterium]
MTPDRATVVGEPGAGWHLQPLERQELALAYPLLQVVEPEPISRQAWQRRASTWMSRHDLAGARGIMTIRSAQGVIFALFFYRIDFRAAAAGSGLIVPYLRLLEPGGRSHTIRAVLDAVERVARDSLCSYALIENEAFEDTFQGFEQAWTRVAGENAFIRHAMGWFKALPSANSNLIVLPHH